MRQTKYALAAFSVALATLAFALASHALDRSGEAEAAPPRHYFAVDGDTLLHRGSGQRYRIANIDTPEIGRSARCAAERRLGETARRRVRDHLAAARALRVEPTGRTDDYGRIVARVVIDGRDLGTMLIAEGVARTWQGRRQPWCDASGRLRA